MSCECTIYNDQGSPMLLYYDQFKHNGSGVFEFSDGYKVLIAQISITESNTISTTYMYDRYKNQDAFSISLRQQIQKIVSDFLQSEPYAWDYRASDDY